MEENDNYAVSFTKKYKSRSPKDIPREDNMIGIQQINTMKHQIGCSFWTIKNTVQSQGMIVWIG